MWDKFNERGFSFQLHEALEIQKHQIVARGSIVLLVTIFQCGHEAREQSVTVLGRGNGARIVGAQRRFDGEQLVHRHGAKQCRVQGIAQFTSPTIGGEMVRLSKTLRSLQLQLLCHLNRERSTGIG
ncbi:hypothetical protein D3C77_542500 [compost metagenome]